MLDEDTTIFWNEAFGNELNMLQRFTDLGYSVVDLSDYGRLSYHIEFMEEVIENKPEFKVIGIEMNKSYIIFL